MFSSFSCVLGNQYVVHLVQGSSGGDCVGRRAGPASTASTAMSSELASSVVEALARPMDLSAAGQLRCKTWQECVSRGLTSEGFHRGCLLLPQSCPPGDPETNSGHVSLSDQWVREPSLAENCCSEGRGIGHGMMGNCGQVDVFVELARNVVSVSAFAQV